MKRKSGNMTKIFAIVKLLILSVICGKSLALDAKNIQFGTIMENIYEDVKSAVNDTIDTLEDGITTIEKMANQTLNGGNNQSQNFTMTFAQKNFDNDFKKMNKTLDEYYKKAVKQQQQQQQSGNTTADGLTMDGFATSWNTSFEKWADKTLRNIPKTAKNQRQFNSTELQMKKEVMRQIMIKGTIENGDTMQNLFKSFDVNSDNLVSQQEFRDGMYVAWTTTVKISPTLCKKVQKRVLVCGTNKDPVGQEFGFDALFIIQNSLCMSGLENQELHNCVLDSKCPDVLDCYRRYATGSVLAIPPHVKAIDLSQIRSQLIRDPARELKGIMLASIFLGVVMVTTTIMTASVIALGWIYLGSAARDITKLFSKSAAKLLAFVTGIEIFFTIFLAISLITMLMGAYAFVGTIQSSFILPQRFDELEMPKVDLSGSITETYGTLEDRPCNIVAYWPKQCFIAAPMIALKNNFTTNQPIRPVCTEGGELWSSNACRQFAGFGDNWSQPCGFAALGCRPMCYKTTLDGCSKQSTSSFEYVNSTQFLNSFSRNAKDVRITSELFTQNGYFRSEKAFFVEDKQAVMSVLECERKCSSMADDSCKGFVVNAPSQSYFASLKCTLLSFGDFNAENPAMISDYRQIIGNGTDSLALDGRNAPFVIAINSKAVFS